MFLGCTSTGRVGLCFLCFLYPGTPEGSTRCGSGFKASQKTGQLLKVSSDRLGEAGNQTCDPWFTRHRFIPYTMAEIILAPLPAHQHLFLKSTIYSKYCFIKEYGNKSLDCNCA